MNPRREVLLQSKKDAHRWGANVSCKNVNILFGREAPPKAVNGPPAGTSKKKKFQRGEL